MFSNAEQEPINWILDTGATYHMTSLTSCLSSVKSNVINCYIKLPNGGQVPITHMCDVKLCNDLTLKRPLLGLSLNVIYYLSVSYAETVIV